MIDNERIISTRHLKGRGSILIFVKGLYLDLCHLPQSDSAADRNNKEVNLQAYRLDLSEILSQRPMSHMMEVMRIMVYIYRDNTEPRRFG